ncbi:MAG: hypothetical protein QM676_03225 [Novosphingobium sp.]
MSRFPSRSDKANSLWRIFRWPTLIAMATIAGLLSALVGDSWADMVSWFLLGTLIVVMVFAWFRAPA